MKEVPEQLRKLRRQYLRYQQAEIIYSISHKKLLGLASDAGADLSRVMVIDDTEETLTLSDDRIEKAVRQNQVRLVIIDSVQVFIRADVDMNRANEVRPVFRKLEMIAEKNGCAIGLIGYLNKSSGTQSTYPKLFTEKL